MNERKVQPVRTWFTTAWWGNILPRNLMGILLGILVGGLVACSDGGSMIGFGDGKVLSTPSGASIVRRHDPEQVRQGEAVYRRHCATCHGERAQGAPDWRRRDADGFYPPPPLDGSGHAWHHPKAFLRERIRNGSPPGEGRMPAWGERLREDEIEAVIEWFQSLWPDPVYAAWYDREQRFLE